jgi:WD40 repeat protein
VARPFPKLFDLKGHKGEVYFVTFSPDGTLLATAGQDHTARIWDATTGKLHCTLTGHGEDVNWISFHALAWYTRWVATASDDKTVRIWNCDTGKCLGVLSTGQSKAVAAEIIGLDRYDHATGEGRKPAYEIVAGDHAGRMHVWDFSTLKELLLTQAHSARIEAITPFREGCWITASDDGTAWEWSGASGARLREHAFDAAIYSVACNSDSTLAAFAIGRSRNETGVVYRHDASGQQIGAQIAIDNLRTGTPWLALTGPGTRGYESVRFFPGRCLLIAASRNSDPQKGAQSLLVWDPPTQEYWAPVEESHPACWCAALSADGSRLATAGTDGIVRVWDSSELPTGTRLPGSFGAPERSVGSLRYSPDGRNLLITHANLGFPGRGDSFVLWDVAGKRPKLLHADATPASQQGSLAAGFSRDGRLIAVADTQLSGTQFEGGIRVLEADSRREVARSSGYDGVFRSLVLSDDGRTVAAATRHEPPTSARLYVWNTDQPAPKLFRQGHGIHFLTMVLSPDGKLLATNEDRVELFEFPSMRSIATLPFQLGICGAIAFSPDGKTLAAGGEAGIIHLWNLATHTHRADMRSDGHAILSLAFSPDGTRLAAGLAGTPRVDLWHIKSGKRLAALALPSDSQSVGDLAFSPDQRTLAAAGMGGTGCAFLFPLGPVEDMAETVRRAGTGEAGRRP